MSFDVRNFKSAADNNVPSYLRAAQNGTTSAIRHDTIMEWGLMGKGARIINNDSAANLDVRLHDPRGTILVVPPNSELVLEEWFSQIHCEPDGTTGNFQLTIEVATFRDAQKVRIKV